MYFILKVIICLASYSLTYFLNNDKGWGNVKSSSFIALCAGFIYQIVIYYNLEAIFLKDYFLIALGGSFMGMQSKIHQHKTLDLILSSFVFCTLYQLASPRFNGLGGLIGTIACISILCVFGVDRIINKKGSN